jgi:capsule polysaccharide export protein KpsC/LpsZ
MNGSSWLANPPAWNSVLTEVKDTLDLEGASQYIADYQVDLRSGWEQPDYESPAQLRARLGIPSHQQIIFIPTQVLADSNMLLHHGRFHNNSSFIKALTTQLHGRTDIFFLVKQHPKEPDLQKDIPAVLKDRGVWTKDVNTFTAIEASCAVMTLNSTVGLEAVMRGKPVVVFAPSLYSHKGFTYEAANDEDLNALVDLFLSGWSQSQAQKLRLLYFIAYLLQYYLIPADGTSNTCAFNKVLKNLESLDNQLGTSENLHTKIANFEQRYFVENRKQGSTKQWKERIKSFFHRKT